MGVELDHAQQLELATHVGRSSRGVSAGLCRRCLRASIFLGRAIEQHARDDDPEQREEQREEVRVGDEECDAEDKRDPSQNVVRA
jgi:hypothetical protein